MAEVACGGVMQARLSFFEAPFLPYKVSVHTRTKRREQEVGTIVFLPHQPTTTATETKATETSEATAATAATVGATAATAGAATLPATTTRTRAGGWSQDITERKACHQ